MLFWQIFKTVLIGLGLIIAASVLAIILFGAPAPAQEMHDPNDPAHWYDRECCSLKDCEAVVTGAFRVTPEGWHVQLDSSQHSHLREGYTVDEVIGWNDRRLRQSKDMDFHACTSTTGRLYCIYVPDFGS